MNKCPLCGSEAYLGLAKVECSSYECEHFKGPKLVSVSFRGQKFQIKGSDQLPIGGQPVPDLPVGTEAAAKVAANRWAALYGIPCMAPDESFLAFRRRIAARCAEMLSAPKA